MKAFKSFIAFLLFAPLFIIGFTSYWIMGNKVTLSKGGVKKGYIRYFKYYKV